MNYGILFLVAQFSGLALCIALCFIPFFSPVAWLAQSFIVVWAGLGIISTWLLVWKKEVTTT